MLPLSSEIAWRRENKGGYKEIRPDIQARGGGDTERKAAVHSEHLKGPLHSQTRTQEWLVCQQAG